MAGERFTKEEKEALVGRIKQLLAEKTPRKQMLDILKYEGYRNAKGKEISMPVLANWVQLARTGEFYKGRKSKPKVKTVYVKPENAPTTTTNKGKDSDKQRKLWEALELIYPVVKGDEANKSHLLADMLIPLYERLTTNENS